MPFIDLSIFGYIVSSLTLVAATERAYEVSMATFTSAGRREDEIARCQNPPAISILYHPLPCSGELPTACQTVT